MDMLHWLRAQDPPLHSSHFDGYLPEISSGFSSDLSEESDLWEDCLVDDMQLPT